MKNILILDDQQLVLISLEKMLSDLNCKVTAAQNIKDAEIYINTIKFDLIMVDINLGDDN